MTLACKMVFVSTILGLVCEFEALAADKVLWMDKKAKVPVTRLSLGYVVYPRDLDDDSVDTKRAPRMIESIDQDLRGSLLRNVRALGYDVQDTTPGGEWFVSSSMFLDVSHGGISAAVGPQPDADAISLLADHAKEEWTRHPEILPSGAVLLALGVYKKDVLVAKDMLSSGYHFTAYLTTTAELLAIFPGKKPSMLWSSSETRSWNAVGSLGTMLRISPTEARRALSESLNGVLASLPACKRP